MKKLFYIILFIFFFQNLYAQHLFQKTYGNLLDDWFWSTEIVSDTDIYAVGYTRENDPMNNTILLTALDDSGNIKWNSSINIGFSDAAFKIMQLSNGTLLLTGDTYDYVPPGDHDVFLINLDYSGNILWKKNWGTSESEFLTQSIQSFDDYIYSTGYIDFNNQDSSALKLIKADENGNIIWDKNYISNYSTVGNDIKKITDNSYFMSGATSASSSSDYDMLLLKTDSSGNPVWAKGYGGLYDEYTAYVTGTNDSGVIIASTSFSFDSLSGNGDILVVRIDSLGNMVWRKKYGAAGHEQIKGIISDTSGNYIIGGSSTSYSPSFLGTGLVFKIDQNGDLVWSRIYGGTNIEVLVDVKQIDDQLLICGQTRSPLPPSNMDGYLIRTDWLGESGCNDSLVSIPYSDVLINSYNVFMYDTTIAFAENLSYSDTALAIQTNILCDTLVSIAENNSEESLSIFPNPTSGILILRTKTTIVKDISVFNVIGKEIFHTEKLTASTTTIDLSSSPKGIYFVKVIQDGKQAVKKIVLL